MGMKRKVAGIVMDLVGLFGVSLSWAKAPMRGPLPEEQRKIVHQLAEHHKELVRKVTMTEKGYTATTTTKNKELAAMLQKHVAYMKKRLDSGAMVRRWDPAYAEMVAHYDDLEATIEVIDGGVKATINGKTPRAVKIAQNHAKIVTSFTKKGTEELHKEHAATSDDAGKKDRGKGGERDSPASVGGSG